MMMMQQPQQQFTISNRYDVLAASDDVTDYILLQQQTFTSVKGAAAAKTDKPKPKPKPKPKRGAKAKVVTDGTTTTTTTTGCGVNCVYCSWCELCIPATNKKTTVDDGGGDPRFPKEMAKQGSDSNWERMLKCFLPLSNGTLPAAAHSDHTTRPALNLSKEAEERFMETKQSQTVYVADVADVVNDSASFFKIPEDQYEEADITSADSEELLDEWQGYVESIDMANELYYSTGCLVPFLNCLYNTHAGVRAKVAQLVTTMVQNNPSSQQLVMEVNGLPPLLYNFTSDPDATSRTKALGAISALIRNNKPGITAFRLANGYAALRDALSSESVRIQREALNLIQYLLHENSSDCNIATELGFPCIMTHLTSSDDAEVREAALKGLLVLAREEEGGNGQLVKNDDKLKRVLQERIEGISAMAPEDLGAGKGGKTACGFAPAPPDVSSKLFEPPLRFFSSVILILGIFFFLRFLMKFEHVFLTILCKRF